MGDLHRDVLERQVTLARERAAERARQLDDVAKRNAEALKRLESEESWTTPTKD
jgi:hypothetical protein